MSGNAGLDWAPAQSESQEPEHFNSKSIAKVKRLEIVYTAIRVSLLQISCVILLRR